MSLRWTSYAPKPSKWGSKTQNVFHVKSHFAWRKSATKFLRRLDIRACSTWSLGASSFLEFWLRPCTCLKSLDLCAWLFYLVTRPSVAVTITEVTTEIKLLAAGSLLSMAGHEPEKWRNYYTSWFVIKQLVKYSHCFSCRLILREDKFGAVIYCYLAYSQQLKCLVLYVCM